MTLERLAWALRNLTHANGLNTAVVAASGISLKALEPIHTAAEAEPMVKAREKQAAPPLLVPKPKPPPRPTPINAEDALATREDVDSSDGLVSRCAGVALTQWSKQGHAW